jgi:hypothetical protein
MPIRSARVTATATLSSYRLEPVISLRNLGRTCVEVSFLMDLRLCINALIAILLREQEDTSFMCCLLKNIQIFSSFSITYLCLSYCVFRLLFFPYALHTSGFWPHCQLHLYIYPTVLFNCFLLLIHLSISKRCCVMTII